MRLSIIFKTVDVTLLSIMILCFIWQSWGDHVDVAQAAAVYVAMVFAIFVYSWFGERLSQQVRIIWLLQTDYSDCLP